MSMDASLLLAVAPLAGAAWQDARHRRIGDHWWLLVLACALWPTLSGAEDLSQPLSGALLVGGPMLLFALWSDRSGHGIGGGDVKLSAALGALLGAPLTYLLLALSTALLVVYLLALERRSGPYAPALLAAYLSYLTLCAAISVRS